MHKHIQISIPSPCSEDWNKMTPQEQGRFCDHCQKCVVDFTSWSDARILDYLSQHKKQEICGRFQTTQLNRAIDLPQQPHSLLYKYYISLGLTLIFTQLPNNVKAQAPYNYNSSIDKLTPSRGCIKGYITDTYKDSLQQAYVEVYQGEKFIANTSSDNNGYYAVSDLTPGRYNVVISCNNYKATKIQNVLVSPDRLIHINATLKFDTSHTKEIIVTEYRVPLTGTNCSPNSVSHEMYYTGRIASQAEIDEMPIRMTNASIPNPQLNSRSSLLKRTWKKIKDWF